jgi:hypothetical protein
MPVIACPGCGKQYKVAATAAGQVAKCACGKRFRLSGAHDKSAAPKAATATPNMASTSTPTTSKSASRAAPAPADDFWDDAISIADKPAPAATTSGSSGSAVQSAKIGSGGPTTQNPSKDKADSAPKRKRKKSKGIRWGFDWGKVAVGLASFVIFGGLTVAIVMSTGRISRGTMYLAVPAIAGLFTAINGLMGEEGIW